MLNNFEQISELAHAYTATGCHALFKQQPEHFKVVETLNFEPSGEGEHLYLYMEKRDTNTDWLAGELARRANLNPLDVGYAGRKDRLAVTQQWFSLIEPSFKHPRFKQTALVNQTLDEQIQSRFGSDEFKVLAHSRHSKKLRKGEIAFNRFTLQLVNFEGSFQSLTERVSELSQWGFPNYFGPQRFGHGGSNIVNALAMLSGKVRVKDKNKRSIYLSAARSHLFNQILSARITQNNWLTSISGDIYWDNKQHGLYEDSELASELANDLDGNESSIKHRLEQGELSITGALAGDGKSLAQGDCLELETAVLKANQSLYQGIANSRIQWQRRALRAIPTELTCHENRLGVELNFSLQTGVYATSLLRELID